MPAAWGGTDAVGGITPSPPELNCNMGQLGPYVPMAPFFEQGPLYSVIAAGGIKGKNHQTGAVSSHTFPPYGPAPWVETDLGNANGYNPWHIDIAVLRCPSDTSRKNGGWWNDAGKVNYSVNAGDTCVDYWGTGTGRGPWTKRWFYPSLADIKDGTSNTLGFSEHTIGSHAGAHNKIHGDYWLGSGFHLDPNQCYVHKGPNGTVIPNGVTTNSRRGAWWGGGGFTCLGFNTVLPPNSVGCNESDGEWGWAQILPPDSYHPGGVNGAYLDGSVRFVAETINAGNRSARCDNISGLSPYGVWGAMGSMAGSESISQ